MYSIPQNALKIGAELSNKEPIKFSKSRISGSNNTSYILHPKGSCMPGQPKLFKTNSNSKPALNESINENKIISAFKLSNARKYKTPIRMKYIGNYLSSFTYDEYSPNDDESLNISIREIYRQVYGNLFPMESERPIDLERRLRNGDLSIREFIRGVAKSPFYVRHYFEKVSQQRSIELTIKHLLGRPPFNQREIIDNIEVLNRIGFENHIDLIIDSQEYIQNFGEDTVPYMRCWNSSCSLRTSSFINSSKLTRFFATSDNSIHIRKKNGDVISGESILIGELSKTIY